MTKRTTGIPHLVARPERVATASIAGYGHQFVYTARRWSELSRGEMIVCEGNEDADVLSPEREPEFVQVKRHKARMSERAPEVRQAIGNFVETFVRHHQEHGILVKGVFSTTAHLVRARGGILHPWLAGLSSPEPTKVEQYLRDEILASACHKKRSVAAPRLNEALNYCLDRGLWEPFLQRVEWRFGADDSAVELKKLQENLATRFAGDGLDVAVLASQLCQEVQAVSSRSDLANRVLTSQRLDYLANRSWLDKAAINLKRSSPELYFSSIVKQETAVVLAMLLYDRRMADGELSAHQKDPMNRSSNGLLGLNDSGLARLLRTIDFDLYVVVSHRSMPRILEILAKQVASQERRVRAIIAPPDPMLVSAVERTLLKRSQFASHKVKASSGNVYCAIAQSFAERILEYLDHGLEHVMLSSCSKRMRCVFDQRSGAIFTQDHPLLQSSLIADD